MASTINAKNTSTGVVITPDSSGQLELQTADTTRMTIDVNGNVNVDAGTLYVDAANNRVGVGTSTPTARLQANVTSAGSNTTPLVISNTSATTSTECSIGFSPYIDTSVITGSVSLLNQGAGAYALKFSTWNGSANTERMRIDSSGNVGIGTSSPGWKLDINGTLQNAGWATLGNFNAGGTFPINGPVGMSVGWNFTSGGREIALMNGDTGATGTTGGFHFFQRTGTATSTAVLRITGNGVYANTTASAANVYVDSNSTLYRSTSALKYKQNVRDLPSLDINKFRPVVYNSKCEGDDQTIDYFGIIADEVDAAGIKELITYGAEGEVEGFQYERLTVVLLKALQEQQELINQLQADVAALKGVA